MLEEGKRGQYQAAMTLLAIVTGAPRSVLDLLNRLREIRKGEKVSERRERLQSAARKDELVYVRSAFEAYLGWTGNDGILVDDLLYWGPRVARFSFRSGRW